MIYGDNLNEEECDELYDMLHFFTTLECDSKPNLGRHFFSGLAAIIALRRFTGISFVSNYFTTLIDYNVDALIRGENNEEVPRAQTAMLKIDELIRDGAQINVRHNLHYGVAILKPRPELGIELFEDWHEGTPPDKPTDAQQIEAADLQAGNNDDLGVEPLDDIAAAVALIDHHRATGGINQLTRYTQVPHNVLRLAQFLLNLNLR